MGDFGVCLVLLVLLVRTEKVQSNSFSVNCGTNSSANVEGRGWIGDLVPGNNFTVTSSGIEASTSTFEGDSVYAPLYRTARFFTQRLNYTFQGAKGNYFLRLHFYPFSFETYNVNDSSFSVEANCLQLVSEYHVLDEIARKNSYLQTGNSSLTSIVKEYFFAVNGNTVTVEFVPCKGSFGFVNAIEIIPVPDNLFVDTVSKVGGNGANTSLNLGKRGIETVFRLNVGGSAIKPNQDLGLWRMWEMDSSFMITANAGSEIRNNSNITYASPDEAVVGPILVYETARTMSNNQVMEKRFNMSWKFEVDPDFDYLIRLHFCELVFNRENQRTFKIYLNNKTAADNFDVFSRAGGKNKAYHQDFFDVVSSKINTLWIQLGPDTTTTSAETDALLNGLEVFKVSRNGNLAYVQTFGNPGGNKNSKRMIFWVAIGTGIAFVASLATLVMVVGCFCKKKRNEQKDNKKNSTGWRPFFLHGVLGNTTASLKGSIGYPNPSGSLSSTMAGKRFTLAEIKAATNNFDEGLVIGVGGFGRVYKGQIEDGTPAAIKRGNPQSEQGLKEFETEIEMLSKLRHRHLVAMIGFCDEHNEMILVYEYMENGTLRGHLFGSELPPLSWKQRLEVCIGAARGLHYLHTGAECGIIHRDVKTTNILLDENFVAKMADFGLSRTGPSLEHTHVSTAVKGSFGYLDPEYFRRQQLTEKSDVYSFGVVLFEVACARAVINPSLPKDQINLAEWAMRWQGQRSLGTIIDPSLKGKYCPESLMKIGEIAENCLADQGKSRPTMGEVLWRLEYVLQIHDAWLRSNSGENPASDSQVLGNLKAREAQETATFDEEPSLDPKMKEDGASAVSRIKESDGLLSGAEEFSLMVNPQGR